jgi:hypothetical protein
VFDCFQEARSTSNRIAMKTTTRKTTPKIAPISVDDLLTAARRSSHHFQSGKRFELVKLFFNHGKTLLICVEPSDPPSMRGAVRLKTSSRSTRLLHTSCQQESDLNLVICTELPSGKAIAVSLNDLNEVDAPRNRSALLRALKEAGEVGVTQ